jgi:hypothetical protein
VREREVEQQAGFLLAGKLVTDIPKTKPPDERDSDMIRAIIQGLMQEVRRDSLPEESEVWRGRQPNNAMAEFDPDELRLRCERCVVVVVRIEPSGWTAACCTMCWATSASGSASRELARKFNEVGTKAGTGKADYLE